MNTTQRARIAGLRCYALHGGEAMTKHLPGRSGANARYWERHVDPDEKLDPAERSECAKALQRAHMIQIRADRKHNRRKADKPKE